MPNFTATPSRIRRISRESEFARSSDSDVLAARPDARDGFSSPIDSFFDTVADAQFFLDERATVLFASRYREAVETKGLFQLGHTLPLTPQLPRFRALDPEQDFDKVLVVRAFAIDFNTNSSAVELIGGEIYTAPENLLLLDEGELLLLDESTPDNPAFLILE